MSVEAFQQIIALVDELADHERAALLAYVQQLESGRVFLCKTDRDIFLSDFLKQLADEAEYDARPVEDWRKYLDEL